jgi:ribosomal protein L21E
MDLIDKYLGEKTVFPSGRKQYTPGDIIKVIKANKKYQGKTGKVVTNLSYPGKKEYQIEVEVDGKKIVLRNTEVEMVKARRI